MKIIYLLSFLAFLSTEMHSQGLEKVIVEKYYIADEKDAASTGAALSSGAVTYRIFLDLLPGYKFQAAFGIPGHELLFSTTTTFFNNEDYGGVIPNVIPDRNLATKTVMLDSWISAGGASEGNLGILKTKDNGINTVVNENGLLQNTNNTAGIPINKEDGLIAGTPAKVTSFGLDSILSIFNKSSKGSKFSTFNGSWATMNGTVGPDSLDNQILIAQITTDGIFTFELNIQIESPDGYIEQYVARNAEKKEILFTGLSYSSISEKTNKKSKSDSDHLKKGR